MTVMPANQESLEHKIEDWLNKNGYPLEMQVAKAFRDNGFTVVQSDYYEDPKTDNYREIDVCASALTLLDDKPTLMQIQYVIECKLSRDKPWVLFASEFDKGKYSQMENISWRIASENARTMLAILAASQEIDNLTTLRIGDRIGYGITQAFKESNSDITYKAAMGVVNACIAKKEKSRLTFTVFFPAIVIDGLLFECFMDKDSAIVLTEVEKGTLVIRNEIGGLSGVAVSVMTKAALQEFSSSAWQSSQRLMSRCKEMLGSPKIEAYELISKQPLERIWKMMNCHGSSGEPLEQ